MGTTPQKRWIKCTLPILACVLYLSSLWLPFWHLQVSAPQYPKGLHLSVFLNRVEGDVQEIDTLNHYIGMRSLEKAAVFERRLAVPGICLIALLLLASIALPGPLRIAAFLPALLFPAVFAGDLYWWLRDFGLHLDPKAPLSSSVKPFIPPLLGAGKIAQFKALANFSIGYYLTLLAAVFVLPVIFSRRRENSTRTKAILAAVFIAPVFLSSPAEASTLHVGEGQIYTHPKQALEKAADGDVIRVYPGIYSGPLTVNKSIELHAEEGATLDGGGHGSVVRIESPRVTFKGFTVRNSGDRLAQDDAGLVVSAEAAVVENNRFEDVLFGIDLRRSPRTVVRGNVLQGKKLPVARRGDLIRVWYSDEVTLSHNRARDGRDIVLWYSKNMHVRENVFEQSRYGLHFMYCADSVIEHNSLSRNSVGAYLMYSADLKLRENQILENRGPSGYGIGLKDMAGAVIERNRVINNRVGFFLDGSSKGLYQLNLVAYNDTGVQAMPSSKENRFQKNNFVENIEHVNLDGASSSTVNDWDGNYWNDYQGYDGDGDGVGEVPYKSKRFFERLTDRFHELRTFYLSPAIQALDYAASVFPIFQPTPKFSDNEPLVAPVALGFKPDRFAVAPQWFLISGILLLPAAGFFRRNFGVSRSLSGSARTVAVHGKPMVLPIKVVGLTKFFKKFCALSDVNVEIGSGEAVALWGPNGAGKTTLMRCLLGISPFRGYIEICGIDVRKKGKEARAMIGYVPQEIRHRPDQTVWEAMTFYAELRNVGAERASKLITEWGLWESRDQLAQNLSGGMKQKLALAVALLSDPPLLFLDEPTSHLDSQSRKEFIALLGYLRSSGKTLLFCSHRSSEILKFADRVVVLENGLVKMDGKPESLEDL